MFSEQIVDKITTTFKIFPDCLIREFLTKDGFSRLFFVLKCSLIIFIPNNNK
jgi:hypothetical protein